MLTCLRQTVRRLSCVSSSEEVSSLGGKPCTTIWCRVRRMVWALTCWPLTSSISAAMLSGILRRSFKENIWMWRSARAHRFFGRPTRGLFWVDPDLSYCAAAQFQGVGNLLVALAIFMQRSNRSFKILRDFFAMWCHVWTFSDQYKRVWELQFKFELTSSLYTWAL